MRASMGALGSTALLMAIALAVEPAMASEPTPPLEGSAWELSELPGRILLPERTATLRFERGRVSGTDGCNRYSGRYKTSAVGFELTAPVMSTKMACPEPAMKQAEEFLSALAGTRQARIEGQQLVLRGAGGEFLAALTAQSQELAGTKWQVTAYNMSTGAVGNLLAGTSISIVFSTDGGISGSAGCNEYRGTYTASGQKVRIEAETVTKDSCQQPAGVMRQEALFLKALATVTVALLDGDQLDLRSRDGSLAIKATRSDGVRKAAVLSGEMAYMADAARFTDCSTGRSYPVAMEADFVKMERAYLAAVKQPGARLYVQFEGTIVDRPKMEGEGSEPTVVVTRFLEVEAQKSCKPAEAPPEC